MIALSEGWVVLDADDGPSNWPAEPSTPHIPIASWQRIYLVAAIIVAVAAALIPLVRESRGSSSAVSDLKNSPRLADLGGLLQHADQWNARAYMPTARARHAIVLREGILYAIAGETASGITASVEAYDAEANTWSPRAPKPLPVSNIEGCAIAEKLVVAGGYQTDGSLTATTQAYDPATDQWTDRAPMPQPLCAYATAAIGDRMYVFGGWGETGFVSSAYFYDFSEDRWQALPPMRQPMGFASAAAIEGRVLVAGGYDGQSELAGVFLFDPNILGSDSDPWLAVSDMTVPRGGLELVASGSEVYAIGGGWRQALEFNERYDPVSDTWSTIPSPLSNQWIHLGAAAFDGRIFAVGGWSTGLLAVNQEYRTLQYRILLPLGSKGGE